MGNKIFLDVECIEEVGFVWQDVRKWFYIKEDAVYKVSKNGKGPLVVLTGSFMESLTNPNIIRKYLEDSKTYVVTGFENTITAMNLSKKVGLKRLADSICKGDIVELLISYNERSFQIKSITKIDFA